MNRIYRKELFSDELFEQMVSEKYIKVVKHPTDRELIAQRDRPAEPEQTGAQS